MKRHSPDWAVMVAAVLGVVSACSWFQPPASSTPVPPPARTTPGNAVIPALAPSIVPSPSPEPRLAVVLTESTVYRSPALGSENYLATLPGSQTIIVLQQQETQQALWYLCQWQQDEVRLQGWIEARRVTLLDFSDINETPPVLSVTLVP